MDKINIKDLEVYAYHGVNFEEKTMGQKFYISLVLSLDLREAGRSDDLNATVNYAELCHVVEEEFKAYKYDLIEKAAEYLAEFLLLKYEKLEKINVCIKKPWAPIGKPLKYVAVEIERAWHRAYIALGSNLGNKEDNIEKAINKIKSLNTCKLLKTSKIYKTKPVGYLEQDDFLNCVIEVKTLLLPSELMKELLAIEKELKRERIIRWGPRTIDLDVILYDDIVTSSDDIVIPHPRMHERLFVLKPLSDIAPYVVHPLIRKRIITLMEELSKEEEM